MQGTFIWYELITTDTAAAVDFYSAVAGWESRSTDIAGFDYTTLHVPGFEMGTAGVMPRPPQMEQAGVPPHWLGYIGVENLEPVLNAMTDQGSTLYFGPQDIPNIGRFASLADPQGAAICLFEPGPHEGEMPPMPAPGTQGTIGWNELHTTDPDAAFSFYSGLFGWQKDMAVDMGEMGPYQTLKPAGPEAPAFAGIMLKAPQIPISLWAYYICVDDIEAGVERVKTHGGLLLNGPHQVPGGSWIANCQDPQGAISLLSPFRANPAEWLPGERLHALARGAAPGTHHALSRRKGRDRRPSASFRATCFPSPACRRHGRSDRQTWQSSLS